MQLQVHYGKDLRSESVEHLVEKTIHQLQNHLPPYNHSKCSVWIDYVASPASTTGYIFECKIDLWHDAGIELFVEKQDAILSKAITKARSALFKQLHRLKSQVKSKRNYSETHSNSLT